jgi:hypothetical protein
MKKYVVILIFALICLFSCKNTGSKPLPIYNGVNVQLLKYIDSIPYCMSSDSFITISFTVDTFSNPIISIKNVGFIPVPPMPHEPNIKKLISEMEGFVGYRRYNNRTLLFLKHDENTKYRNLINPDSLTIDEKPFDENDAYNYTWTRSSLRRKKIELVLRIEGKDSLVLLNKENNNVYW